MNLSLDSIDLKKLTPMMQQYIDQKEKWPDCILFFRLGDFYEMFFDDALQGSKALDLTLTGRDCGQAERAPMCGVPYHAADVYINRLIQKGFKVAICEQVEDPAQSKGIVKREVTRVITPGTILDSKLLEEKRNNYMMSIYALNSYFGLAVCDLTTGSFEATSLVTGATLDKLEGEIARYAPSEILCNQNFLESGLKTVLADKYNVTMTGRPDDDFSLEQAKAHFSQTDDQQPLWAQAAAALLNYLIHTQRVHPGHLKPVQVYQLADFMNLDPTARRNLELTETIRDKNRRGSLLWAIDKTLTAAGGRLIRRWLEQPLLNISQIQQRLSAVADLKEHFILRQELRERLAGLNDLERLAGKVALSSVNARDLLALRYTLSELEPIIDLLRQSGDSWLLQLTAQIDPLPDLCRLLQRALQDEPAIGLKEGQIIRDGYDETVDQLRRATNQGKDWIISLESAEREKTGIKSLKVRYNRVFGYYIEVTRTNLTQVPEHYVRKQTLANGERYITPELKEMEDTILGAEQKIIALEYELFCGLRDQVGRHIESIQQTAHALAAIDVLQGLAELAERENYCRPSVDLSDRLLISQGRHPVVEKVLGPGQFVPNDLEMDMQSQRVMILTGPNMAGKSTYMRQVAQIVLLAQMGSYVPAASAHIGLVDRVFTRVGASDDLASGQSTFMVEMNEVAQILSHATPRSLLILDEIGRGTSTYDGLSIAWSVIEYVADRLNLGCRTLFATHYHELTNLESVMPGVYNCHVEVSEQDDEVVFLHQISRGGSDDSYGIEVARLAGVPAAVVQRAQEILIQLEKENIGQKAKIRSHARPMDGQIDLFASSAAMQKAEQIIKKLQTLDIQTVTPLDALNILSDLQRKAGQTGGSKPS
jgi:DNA mismatch repair protein MutS